MYWKYFPHKQAQQRINDVRALHDMLSNRLDDLEDVMVRLRDFCKPSLLHVILHLRCIAETGSWRNRLEQLHCASFDLQHLAPQIVRLMGGVSDCELCTFCMGGTYQ